MPLPPRVIHLSLMALLSFSNSGSAESASMPSGDPPPESPSGAASWAGPVGGPSASIASIAPSYRPDALIVQLRPTVPLPAAAVSARRVALGLPALDRVLRSYAGAWIEPEFPAEAAPAGNATASRVAERSPAGAELERFWVVHLDPGADLEDALARFRALDEVAAAFPIARMPALAVPNDSLWSAATYFRQPSRRDVHAVEAWDVTVGDTAVIVAIIDTGVLPEHPDLAGQFWTNWAERNGRPGVDDDANGFVDDDHGWDFVDLPSAITVRFGEDASVPDNDPSDFAGHGTACAGLVGAATNNRIGVAGTAWKVRLMPLRIGWSSPQYPSGEGDVSYMAQAVRYATRMGAQVINISFTTANQPDLDVAVTAAVQAGVTIVTAAGNFGVTHYLAYREDAIAVGATDNEDVIPGWSTCGPHVDIAAPGYRLASTTVDRDDLGHRFPDYTVGASGTSFSAPLVAGAVALMQSDRRAHGLTPLTPFEVRMRLMDTADDIGSLNVGSAGYGTGRLNLLRALADPPTSRLARAPARLAGPGVAIPGPSGLPKSVVVPTTDGWLLEMDGVAGTLQAQVRLSVTAFGGVAAADMGPGSDGVEVFVATQDGRLYGFDSGLRRLPGWPVLVPTASAVAREPVLGDIDGDDALEVLWGGGKDGKLWVWRANGSLYPGFPKVVAPAGTDLAIALTNLDGVHGAEMLVAGSDGWIHALTDQGTELAGWPVRCGTPFAPIVVESGGAPLVIAATRDTVRALRPDGTTAWIRSDLGPVIENPVAADLDLDGRDEILLLRPTPGLLTVVDPGGHQVPAWSTSPPLTGQIRGEPMIGPIGPAGEAGILLSISTRGLVAFDAGAQPLRNFPKPGGVTIPSLIDDLDGDGRAETVSGSTTDPNVFFYVSGHPQGSPRPGWVTRRGNYARTGSRLYAPAMERHQEGEPPSAIEDLAVTHVAPGMVELTWTAPASGTGGAVERYDVRYSSDSLTNGNLVFAPRAGGVPDPLPPGNTQHTVVTGPDEAVAYRFAIRSVAPGGWSAISNVARATMPEFPPDAVNDLRLIAATDTTLTIRWIGTGEDGALGRAHSYLVRAAEAPFDSAGFDAAPLVWNVDPRVDAGSFETFVLSDLVAGRDYWVAVIAVDHRGNRSAMSSLLHVAPVTIAPDPVFDLTVLGRTDHNVTLQWTATGDDGRVGRPMKYHFAADTMAISDSTFELAPLTWDLPANSIAGGTEVTTIFGLQSAHHYWIGVVAIDFVGNRSSISNIAEFSTLDTIGVLINDLRMATRNDTSISLQWTAVGDGSYLRPLRYQLYAAEQPLSEATLPYAPIVRSVVSNIDAGGIQRFTISGLQAFHRYWFAVTPVDHAGAPMNFSNVIDATLVQVAPSQPRELRLRAWTDTTLTFIWMPSGEDGQTGRALQYVIRAADSPMADSTFDGAPFVWIMPDRANDLNGRQVGTISGMQPNHHYWAAVMAVDYNGNRSRISANVEVTTIQVPPFAPSGLRVLSRGDTSATLQWRTTGDDGLIGIPLAYRIRAATVPITMANFDDAPLRWEVPGRNEGAFVETTTVSGFAPERHYWIAMLAVDRNGNLSPLANVIEMTTPAIAPFAVHDLKITGRLGDTVSLTWTATGEDGILGRPDRYLLRAAQQPIDSTSFDAAPLAWERPATVDGGELESATLGGIDPALDYWFAIAAVDHAGNRSPISNVVDLPTPVLSLPPIRDLTLDARTASSMRVRWTFVQADAALGSGTFQVRAAERTIDEATFDDAPLVWEVPAAATRGQAESFELSGLTRERRYWVAVATLGEGGRSAISNVLEVWIGRLAGLAGPALACESRPSLAPVRLLWRTSTDRGADASAVRVFDVRGRLCATLPLAPGREGVVTWDGRDRDGRPVPAGMYFARLAAGDARLTERIVLLK